MASSPIILTDQEMAEAKRLEARGTLSFGDVSLFNRRASKAFADKLDRYAKYMDAVDEMLVSNDSRAKSERDRVNLALKEAMVRKDIAAGTVHQNATLSNLSIQYANEEYIGEQLMPVLQVAKETDTYYLYGQRDRVQYPDDTMGSRGQANEIQETRTTATYTCLPRGFSNFIAQRTLNNQDAPLDEMVDVVEAINEGLAFRRELRLATEMTTAARFGANTNAIAAANRWDTAGGGDPIANIQTAMAGLWSGRGPGDVVMYSSLDVYNVLSRHPAILDLFKYGGTSPGLATPDLLARFFGASRYLVGKARQDTAVEGQAATFARIWGDVFGMVRVARRASVRNAAFGYTFRHGAPETALVFEPLKGHGGGFTAQVSTSETHNVVASPTGWLITTPIG